MTGPWLAGVSSTGGPWPGHSLEHNPYLGGITKVMANRRPTVQLTVARINGRPLTHLEVVELNRVLVHHDQPNRDALLYACLACQTIGEIDASKSTPANLKSDRDRTLATYGKYFTCHLGKTVLFRTESV